MAAVGPLLDASDRRFPRAVRLLAPGDFKRVFSDPCRAGGRGLTLLARPNGLGYPRLGLAIAKKRIKTAVGRNRVKRQIRESFRHHRHELDSLDVVVVARHDILAFSTRQLRTSLDSQWHRLAQRCVHS